MINVIKMVKAKIYIHTVLSITKRGANRGKDEIRNNEFKGTHVNAG